MTSAANAHVALIRASWADVPAGQPNGTPVDCLSNEAIAHARELAAFGMGTVTFTANRRAAFLLGIPVPPLATPAEIEGIGG